MVVLSRETIDRIQMGERSVATEMRGNEMQIGIAAPKDVHELRSVIQEPIGEPRPEFVSVSVASLES
jgi:sRNA-binding carbon storage regulator CsrA